MATSSLVRNGEVLIPSILYATKVYQGRKEVEIVKETAQLFAEVRQMIIAPDPWIARAIIQLEYLWEELEGGELTEDALMLHPGVQDLIKVVRGQLRQWTKDARKAAEKAQTRREELASFDWFDLHMLVSDLAIVLYCTHALVQ